MAEAQVRVPKQATRTSDYPQTKEEWVKYVVKKHDEALDHRKKHELQWAINLAYYKGFQNLAYDRMSGFLHVMKDNVPEIIVNRIGSFIDGRHAKIAKNRPAARVLPN